MDDQIMMPLEHNHGQTEPERNDCQQLITKSHGLSWLDSYFRKATPTFM